MASVSPPRAEPIPFWRDTRVIAIILQIVFLVVIVALLAFFYTNMITGLQQSNLMPNLSFLSQPAGFPIAEGPPYAPSDSYAYAFVVGIANTLRVAVTGIILATILGVILGISRLSSNWLLRNTAMVYVEIVRNVPLLLQLLFWFALTKAFPRVQESLDVFGLMYLHNRGVTMAWPQNGDTFAAWLPWIYGGLALGALVYVGRRIQLVRQDRPGLAWPWALLAALVAVAVGWLAVELTTGRAPLYLETPELQRFNFQGGITLTSSFAALLVGLTIYTATFIGEIVRSGIMAVSKGQREAARALGLSGAQTLRLVIFPQALRVMIPPLTSQYLNLTKNSSLAIAVAYPDLFYVSGTILNQTGQTVTVILMIMASYLSVSLLTSLVMNLYNRKIQLVER